MKEYDLVIVGSGVGLSVLNQGLNMGWKVAIIEDAKFGGTCLTRGCIPSKVLVHPADLIREAEHAKKVGLNFKLEKFDWKTISKRMWEQIDESKGIERGLSGVHNLDVYKGIGEFTVEYTMKVKLNKGGYSEEFKGKKIILATGARNIIPPIPGLEDTGYITSKTFFGEKFPEKKPWDSLVIIGGGIIAAEFAHIFSAFGTKVTVVEMLPRLLSTEEPEISSIVEKVFRKNMDVYVNHKAIGFKKKGSKKVAIIEEMGTGKKKEIEAEEIFMAVGVRSNADWLKVEKTGVETNKNGWIETNRYLETTKENIWAIGDANGQFLFRHKANSDAEVATRNIFGAGEKKPVDYSAVPWAIYTYPQVAHVGLTQQQAIETHPGEQLYVAVKRYSSVAKGFAMGYSQGDDDDGLFKLIVDSSYKILGAHAVGPHAAILVQPFVYLMNAGFSCAPEEDMPLEQYPKYMRACPDGGSFMPIYKSMVIHPSLNEVPGWAIGSLRPVGDNSHGQSHSHNH